MTHSQLRAAGVAAVIALAAAGASFAQSPPPGGPAPGAMRMMRLEGPGPEARAQRLRDILQLTPAQEPALKAFLLAQKPPGPPAPPQAGAKALTTPERLDRQRARLVERLAAFDQRLDATGSILRHRHELRTRTARRAPSGPPSWASRWGPRQSSTW